MASIPNTLGVAAGADELHTVTDLEQLRGVLRRHPQALVVGSASNVVLPTSLARPAVRVGLRGIWSTAGAGGGVEVTAAAGESWHAFVRYCLAQGWYGLENLALIPGSVGAAPIQNIGAYGVELAQRFVRLRAIRVRDGQLLTFNLEECGLRYRDSYFKSGAPGEFVVVDVTLALTTQAQLVATYPDVQQELAALGRPQPGPVDVAEAVIRVRRRKLPDPARHGNVGSFFKNPVVSARVWRGLRDRFAGLTGHPTEGAVKLSAAQLIDLAGGKQLSVGAAYVWPRQPLVLVNAGGATGADFVALATRIQELVQARFDIQLEIEPQIVH